MSNSLQLSQYDQVQDTIFISGLPEDTTEKQLEEYFGVIGIIKKDKKTNSLKIWIYRDKTTGRGKGEATITYDDPPTAGSAIKWFSGKEFHGSTITVEFAQRKSAPASFCNRRGGGAGGGGSTSSSSYNRGSTDDRRKINERPGDWACPECKNKNFSYRSECNRCHEPRPASFGDASSNNDQSRNNERGRDRRNFNRDRRDFNHDRRNFHRDRSSYGDRGDRGGSTRSQVA